MKIMFLCIWVALFIQSILCADYRKCGDDDGNNSTIDCPCETPNSKLKQGSESKAMCLIFDGYKRSDKNLYYFTSVVDEFTLLQLQNSTLYNDTMWNASYSTVSVQVGDYKTVPRTIIKTLENDNVYIMSPLTIVIVLNNGRVESITWDDGCYTCYGDESCINGNCGTRYEVDTHSNSLCDTQGTCDFKLFVSWYGTDKKGNYLLSAGQRLSQFQQASAQSYFNYAKGEVNTVEIPVPENPYENPV
jgi:hypothetical protein